VGLDEPAILLIIEVRQHLVDVARLHVEPRRDPIQRTITHRALKDQQRTDHLHPRRTAFRWRTNDDVAGAHSKRGPPCAVENRRPVPDRDVVVHD
jgi:hypothetical protein